MKKAIDNNTISTIIWDLGGVLVRTEDPLPRQKLAAELGLTVSELEKLAFGREIDNQGQLGVIDYQTHWMKIIERLGRDQADLDWIRSQFFAGDRVDYELVDYIRSLRVQYKTGLLSNAFLNLRELMISVWRIDDAFDRLVISAEIGMMKPDPKIYYHALNELEVKPEQAVFVDDQLANVEAAWKIGMRAIQFKNHGQAKRELEALLDGAVT